MNKIKIQSYFCGICFLGTFLLFALIGFQVSYITFFQSAGATLILWFLRAHKIKELNQRAMALLPTFWKVRINEREFKIADHELAMHWLRLLDDRTIIQAQAMNVMRVARTVLKKACFDLGLMLAAIMVIGVIFAYPQFEKFTTEIMTRPGQLSSLSGLIDRMFNIYFIVIAGFIYVTGSGFGYQNCFKAELAKRLAGNAEQGGVVSIVEYMPDADTRMTELLQMQ